MNIGTRQVGRLRAKSIIDTSYNKNSIKKAIMFVLTNKKFKSRIKTTSSLYGNGNSAKKIIKILETLNLNKISIQKQISY